MSTKAYRQPFWLAADSRTVMTWRNGVQCVEWTAPTFADAAEYAALAVIEWQEREYGHADPHLIAQAEKRSRLANPWGTAAWDALDPSRE